MVCNVPRDGRRSESPDQLREKAARVRRLARELRDGDEAAKRLSDYAAELEAQALAIENDA